MWKKMKSRFKKKAPLPTPRPTPRPVAAKDEPGVFDLVRDQLETAIDATRKTRDAARRITDTIGAPPPRPAKKHH